MNTTHDVTRSVPHGPRCPSSVALQLGPVHAMMACGQKPARPQVQAQECAWRHHMAAWHGVASPQTRTRHAQPAAKACHAMPCHRATQACAHLQTPSCTLRSGSSAAVAEAVRTSPPHSWHPLGSLKSPRGMAVGVQPASCIAASELCVRIEASSRGVQQVPGKEAMQAWEHKRATPSICIWQCMQPKAMPARNRWMTSSCITCSLCSRCCVVDSCIDQKSA